MISNYKAMQLITSIMGVIMIVFLISLNVMYFYPYTVVRLNCPAEVSQSEVKPGEKINYRLRYNKKLNIPEIVSQQLVVGNELVNFGHSEGILDIKSNSIDLQLLIPKDIRTGSAKIKIFARYSLFWGMRIVDVERETETFIITSE